MAKRSKKKAIKRLGGIGQYRKQQKIESMQPAQSGRRSMSDIMKSFHDVTKADFYTQARKWQAQANRQISYLRKRYPEAPALRFMEESGGKISINKDMTIREMRREAARAIRFLESQTSRAQGVREWITNTKSAISKQANGKEIDESYITPTWNIYNDLKNMFPQIATDEEKYKVLLEIYQLLEDGKSMEEAVLEMQDKLQEGYMRQQEASDNFEADNSGYLMWD